jgi:hypothetical protein
MWGGQIVTIHDDTSENKMDKNDTKKDVSIKPAIFELTNEQLSDMQRKLFESFNYTSTSAETRASLGTNALAILAIETEKRTRAEYKPHKTLQKD